MSNYENGSLTRQSIVLACKRLFYEKGFHETSYSDICDAAHVNRGTIYYHFKTKDIMLYEVMWEFTTDCKHLAENYCKKSEYLYILALYLQWHLIRKDEKFRAFSLSGCLSTPVYTGKKDFSYYYSMVADHICGIFDGKHRIPELSFASAYGYIMCCVRLMCEHPDKYDPREMFKHCIISCISIWGIPKEKAENIWDDIQYYISLIPEEEITVTVS